MEWSLEIVESESATGLLAVQELWRNYWRALGLPPDFQGFEEESRSLPGKYAPPAGRLLLLRIDDHPAGTVAFRPLGHDACEAKRLYVHTAYRRCGVARSLLKELIKEARLSGYRAIYGDTLPTMDSALDLYRNIGFKEIKPYSNNPTPGAIYLRLALLISTLPSKADLMV